MNIVDYNDKKFLESEAFKEFIKNNPSKGYLNIRAYAANQAIPVSGLKVIVSKDIDNNKVIFYEGLTDNSGLINSISLPAPSINKDDTLIPNVIKYDVEAKYEKDNIDLFFKINIYSNINVYQNINIVPDIRLWNGGIYGN